MLELSIGKKQGRWRSKVHAGRSLQVDEQFQELQLEYCTLVWFGKQRFSRFASQILGRLAGLGVMRFPDDWKLRTDL